MMSVAKIKISLKKNVPKAFIWRINPKECTYDKIDPLGDLFSSRESRVGQYAIKKGDFICAIASGTGRKKGLLGIWCVTGNQFFGSLSQTQACYIPPHDKRRQEKQHRAHAKLYKSATMDNLSQIKQIIPSTVFYIPYPTPLAQHQFDELLKLT
jgi:hypothetical protein